MAVSCATALSSESEQQGSRLHVLQGAAAAAQDACREAQAKSDEIAAQVCDKEEGACRLGPAAAASWASSCRLEGT